MENFSFLSIYSILVLLFTFFFSFLFISQLFLIVFSHLWRELSLLESLTGARSLDEWMNRKGALQSCSDYCNSDELHSWDSSSCYRLLSHSPGLDIHRELNEQELPRCCHSTKLLILTQDRSIKFSNYGELLAKIPSMDN